MRTFTAMSGGEESTRLTHAYIAVPHGSRQIDAVFVHLNRSFHATCRIPLLIHESNYVATLFSYDD
jgi:hypothetical protein